MTSKIGERKKSFFVTLKNNAFVIIVVILLFWQLVNLNVLQRDISVILTRLQNVPASRHQKLRVHFIISQIKSFTENYFLIAGDSIIENIYFRNIANHEVVNAGIGGSGLNGIESLITQIPDDKRLKYIIIMIGVNDAKRNAALFDHDAWAGKYQSVITEAKRKSEYVYICPVIPLEGGKGLGPEYFDESTIYEINKIIRSSAVKNKVGYIDTRQHFIEVRNIGKTFTTDGVHLTTESMIYLRELFEKIILDDIKTKKNDRK